MLELKSCKRIDFLGAPGVGKSTFYYGLVNKTIQGILPEEKALIHSANIMASGKAYNKKLLLNVLLKLPQIQSVISAKFAKAHDIEKFIEVNEVFFENVIGILQQSNRKEHLKFMGYSYFIDKIHKWAFMQDTLEGVTVLSDESISQKIYGITSSEFLDFTNVHKYFKTMPAPNALIYIYNNRENIYENLMKRERETSKLIPSHRNRTKSELLEIIEIQLSIAELGKVTLKERGVEVLEIDLNSYDKSHDKMLSFVNCI